MPDYTKLTAEERFAQIDRMATQLFETKRWKTEFYRRYDITVQSVNGWKRNGAPVWPCVALEDALAAKRLVTVQEALADL